MKIKDAITISVAVARLTKLVTSDEITDPIRDAVDDWARGYPVGHPRERISYLVSCPRCVSVWAAAACLALWYTGTAGRSLVGLLAASQTALFLLGLEEMMENKE